MKYMKKYYIANKRFLLLPNLLKRQTSAFIPYYEIWGWNWFDLLLGCWNSCVFKTQKEALESYKSFGYKVKEMRYKNNADLSDEIDELFEI
jgi:hypothetical protein